MLFRMCWLALGLCLAANLRAAEARRPATQEETDLLQQALKNTAQETERWAYTETSTVKVSKGSERGATIVQFDPSKPYAEQYTPIKINGKDPSEKQLKDYRKRGEKRGQRVARAAETARGNPQPEAPTLKLGQGKVKLDHEHPLVVEETPGYVVYQIPIHAEEKLEIPIEKFELLARVGRERKTVENIRLRLLESFRVKLVAKLQSGEANVDFEVVDPKYPPVVTRMAGNFNVSVLFIAANGVMTNIRSDFRRVKPYDDRFEVKLGPLKTLDF